MAASPVYLRRMRVTGGSPMRTYEAYLITLPTAEELALGRARRVRTKRMRAHSRLLMLLAVALVIVALWRINLR